MVAGSRFRRCEVRRDRTNCQLYSKKADQLSWIGVEKGILPALLLLSLLFLLTSLTAAAQISREMYTVSAQELRVPARARAHLKLAQREFSRSNFAGAKKEIDQALQVDAICAPAFSMRALLRLASRDLNGAIEDATRALALDPTEADANVALATAYNSLGEFQKAEAAAQQTLGMRPDFWQGRLELAKAFYGQERLVLALRELDELDKDFPDVHLVRANILMRLKHSEEAAIEFSRFLREAPNDPRREQIQRIVNRANATGASTPSHQ
jgi:tetratricopeptide (TPR) repeat protein